LKQSRTSLGLLLNFVINLVGPLIEHIAVSQPAGRLGEEGGREKRGKEQNTWNFKRESVMTRTTTHGP
jgi:hypothetical protein